MDSQQNSMMSILFMIRTNTTLKLEVSNIQIWNLEKTILFKAVPRETFKELIFNQYGYKLVNKLGYFTGCIKFLKYTQLAVNLFLTIYS